MLELTNIQIAKYLYHSYAAVDGLWFMKTEDKYGFDAALEIDKEVWQVMPKIQARMLKEMMGFKKGKEALLECLSVKLSLDGFEFKTEKDDDGINIIVSKCPWHELLLKSNRGHLSDRIGSLVCGSEYPVWASEFGEDIHFEMKEGICKGSPQCVLRFGS